MAGLPRIFLKAYFLHNAQSGGHIPRMDRSPFAVVLLTLLWAALTMPATAAEYPLRPIRFIVPSAPGGTPDIISRLLAVELSRQMGQHVVVDNRPGANGAIGLHLLAKGTADGGAGSARLGAWMRPGSGP